MKSSLEDIKYGMTIARKAADNGAKMKYLDWDRAEQIVAEHPDSTIFAGLMEDWNCTSGLIYDKGKYCRDYVYCASIWATPILDVDGEEIECWTYENTKNGEHMPKWWGKNKKK